MTENLQIHFNLDGQAYDVNLSEAAGISSENKVVMGGVEYSLQGSLKGTEFTKKWLEQINQDFKENLSQVGNELKARLWLAGAKDITLTTIEEVHKIGLRSLMDGSPIDVHQTIHDVCRAMEEEYVFPDVAKKCSQFLQKQLEEGVYDAISDLEVFAQAVTADLRQISEDKHIEVSLISKQSEHEIEKPVESIKEPIVEEFSRPNLLDIFEYKAPSNIGWMDDLMEASPMKFKRVF